MDITKLKALAEDRDKKRILFELHFKSLELELSMLRICLQATLVQVIPRGDKDEQDKH